ncbi:uncharacterized protein METZ01_LOCUS352160, partial [marine metagenome]
NTVNGYEKIHLRHSRIPEQDQAESDRFLELHPLLIAGTPKSARK